MVEEVLRVVVQEKYCDEKAVCKCADECEEEYAANDIGECLH